jgi:SAM-dependent methyltransferase
VSDAREAYDAWHRQRAAAADPLVFPWYASAFADIDKNARGRLLEVGCGRGDFAIWLARTMPHLDIAAVDFSGAAIELARSRAAAEKSNIIFSIGDAERLELPDRSFDYVVSCECIEHVEHPAAAAREIRRVLKPGGRFCLTTENYFNGMLIAWLNAWATRQPFDSGAGVQPRENFLLFWRVRRYLQDAGLAVDRTESCHYQWLLLPGVDPARLCTRTFSSAWASALAKPFGRHFSFFGHRPPE